MKTHATTSSESDISITESGLAALRLAVRTDATEETMVVVETKLPPAVDPETIAVELDAGEWTVYADGTVHWRTTAPASESTTGSVGVPVADPATVDALADADVTVLEPEEAPAPTRDGEPIPTVDVADLSSATPADRVPESVYERIREHAPGESTNTESTASTNTESTASMDDDAELDECDAEFVVATAAEAGSTNPPRSTAEQQEETSPEPSESVGDARETGRTEVGDHATDGDHNGERDRGDGGNRVDDQSDSSVGSENWAGDAFENALRVQDDHSHVGEHAFRFRLSFDVVDATTCAIEVLRGLLNGTTVYGASPTLPDLEAGENPDELTVTITSALDENALVGALENLDAVTLESFERVDVEGVPSDKIESNADQQFQLLDETVETTEYDEFADDLDAVEAGGFDFGDEPVSFDDLVDDPEGACDATADQRPKSTPERDTNASDDDSGRVAERLLDELQAGGVTERERVELRRRLGVDPRTSTEARLDHLHARFDELAAYTDALEAFLDENGSGQDILDRLDERTDTLDERTDALDDRTEALDSLTGALDEQTDSLTERTDTIDDRIEELEAALEDESDARAEVEAHVDVVESEVETERERVDDVSSDLDRERERIDDVEGGLETERNRLDDVSSAVRTNRDDLDHLAEDVRMEVRELTNAIEDLDDAIAGIDDRLERLERDVERNSEVREKLQTLSS